MTKCKGCKRKQIQQGGIIEYSVVSAQVAAEVFIVLQLSKKAYGGSNYETAQPALPRCGNCGGTGHNARTCKKDIEESSESNISTIYAGSLFNSD